MDLDELNALLAPQGLKAVPHHNEQALDVKLRPTPVDEQVRRLEGAIAGLATLARHMGTFPVQAVRTIEQVFGAVAAQTAFPDLANLFTFHGSDKALFHDYYRVYGALLAPLRQQPVKLLEIGLGTNNIDVPSNMGPMGRPGASLRTFRDWLPLGEIHGADVDRRILFTEERIETHFVDQTQPATLRELAVRFEPHSFDVIIDDGLHVPVANINTVFFALGLLKDDGVLVVEDIGREHFDFWCTVFALLGGRYTCHFLQTKAACMVLIGRTLPRVA